MKNKKPYQLGILTALIILTGFLRDYLFANINWIYLTLTNGRRNGARLEFYFFLEWTPQEIVILKWVLTGIFTLLFLLITYLFVNTAFRNKQYNKITLMTYAAITVTALSLFMVGKLIGKSEELYGAIHTLMTIVQSFMPLMILYILFRFLPQELED